VLQRVPVALRARRRPGRDGAHVPALEDSRGVLYYETLKHDGSFPIVGVNTFLDPNGSPTVDSERSHSARLKKRRITQSTRAMPCGSGTAKVRSRQPRAGAARGAQRGNVFAG